MVTTTEALPHVHKVGAKPRLNGVNHIAYVAWDMPNTLKFYTEILNLRLTHVEKQNRPDMRFEHYFFDMGDGRQLAFFYFPDVPREYHDTKIPHVGLHIAFQADTMEDFTEALEDLRAKGVDVTDPVDHGFCQSIYFNDPNGILCEIAVQVREFDVQDEQAAWKIARGMQSAAAMKRIMFDKPGLGRGSSTQP